MKLNHSFLTLFFGLTFLISCAQNSKHHTAEIFLDFINNYQVDSLKIILSDSFQLKRTYTKYTNDKKSFIDKYVPNSKNFNGKFKVLKTIKNNQATEFLVEDQSDYHKFLNIDYPKWKLYVSVGEQEKIVSMTIDTTENYQTYLSQTKEKGEQFENWLKQKYPDESQEQLYNTEGLLTKRLKEYSKK